MSEELNTFIPRVTPTTNLLTKYIAQTAYDRSFLEGRENLQAIKSVAVGAPINPPDQSEDILDGLDSLELSDDSLSELSDEELEEKIRERKERQKEEEMLIQERKEARETLEMELQVKSTGSTENPTLSVIAPDTTPAPVVDKSTKVAKTYTPPPQISLSEEESGVKFTNISAPDTFSSSSSESPGISSSSFSSSQNLDTKA